MYVRSGSVIINDGYTFGMSSIISKRSFGTMSVMCARHQPIDIFRSDSPANLANKCPSSGLCVPYRFCNRNNYIQVEKDESDTRNSKKSTPIHANMVARYSNTLKGTGTLNALQNLSYRQNMSFTKSFEDLTSLLKLQTIGLFLGDVPYDKNATIYRSLRGHYIWDSEPKEIDWILNVEAIIDYLKRAMTLKERKRYPQPLEWRKNQVSRPALQEASWIDRVVQTHKSSTQNTKFIPDNGTQHGKNSVTSNSGDQLTITSSRSPLGGDASSMSEYIHRGPINQNRTTKDDASQNVIAGGYGGSEEPQVELRMSSTQNESVVSINVESNPHKGSPSARELSVVVQSNKDVVANSTTSSKVLAASPTLQKRFESNFQNTNAKLNSMRISISEESVPVKQIEFAINGKPVSQLKSIIARSNKLDVVTSVDKIEIRVPFTKDKGKPPVDHAKVIMQGATVPKPVLNLQISANFDETHRQPYGYTPYTTETKPIADPPAPPESPANSRNPPISSTSNEENDYKFSNRTTNTSGGDGPPPTDPILMHGHHSIEISPSNPRIPESNTQTYPAIGNQSHMNASDNQKLPELQVTKSTFTKEENRDRAPSTMIPWWASDNSFNKLKKTSKTKSVDSSSSSVHSKNPPTLDRSDHAEDPRRLLKFGGVPVHKSNRLANSISSYSPRKRGNIKKSRSARSLDRKSARGTGKKGREGFIWQRIPDMVQNVDGVSIKLKRKLDHDTIHVQDQLKISGSKASAPNIKSKASEQVSDPEEKSKIFHRDSVIVKTKPLKSNTTQTKEAVKVQAEKTTGNTGKKSFHEEIDLKQAKQEKKSDNIFLSDSAVKSFMDAMKPIEKRKDGTLIDFGMKVSSRRMPEKQSPGVNKIRSKPPKLEKIKVSSTSSKTSSTSATEKMFPKESKILHEKKESNSTIILEKVGEETLPKLSSKPLATDTKSSANRPNVAEKKASQQSTIKKIIEGTQKSTKSTVKPSRDSKSSKKADTLKSSSTGAPKKSPTKDPTVRSPQSSVDSQKWRVNTARASSESVLRDSSQTPVAPKEEMLPTNDGPSRQLEKKVATFSVEKKMASAASSSAQTTLPETLRTTKNNIELSEKAAPPTASAGTNSVKDKKPGTSSARSPGTVTDQSLKRVVELITKRENPQEGSSSIETSSDFELSMDISDLSGSVFPKLAINAAALRRCKSGSPATIKTSSGTRNQKSSKHPKKKEKPTCVNTTS